MPSEKDIVAELERAHDRLNCNVENGAFKSPEHKAIEVDEAMELCWRAKAEIARLRAGVPEGWQLVPMELTDEMIDAAVPYADDEDFTSALQNMYRAMLAAAPPPADVEGLVKALETIERRADQGARRMETAQRIHEEIEAISHRALAAWRKTT